MNRHAVEERGTNGVDRDLQEGARRLRRFNDPNAEMLAGYFRRGGPWHGEAA